MADSGLALFEGYGIEIEAMIVDRGTLGVRPIADELLRAVARANDWVEDFEDGAIAWSNELVAHVLELKTNGPAPSLAGLATEFDRSTAKANAALAPWDARLMPGGMHPWMDPRTETRIWPHGTAPVYRAYDRLFDCRRHGWANLQSVHLNLPFRGEVEFARLMAAVRIVLPLIPALAASTPFVDGRPSGFLDSRLEVYRTNTERAPSSVAEVIPEAVFGFDAYRREVLDPIEREFRGLGADPVLIGQEWTNARGAIARFDRMAIEIRLIDAQECASANLAVAAAVAGLVRSLVEERHSDRLRQEAVPNGMLVELLDATIRRGRHAALPGTEYGEHFGAGPRGFSTVGELLQSAVDRSCGGAGELSAPLALVLERGSLAERILEFTGPDPDRGALFAVGEALCDCLAEGRSLLP